MRGGNRIQEQKDDPLKTPRSGSGYNRGITKKIKVKRNKGGKREHEKTEEREEKEEEDGERKQEEDRKEERETETITEVNIFVPHTAYSRLCQALQTADNRFSTEHNLPRVRFTEKGGTTVSFQHLRFNPWARDWWCGREDCLPCNSRITLEEEVERAQELGVKPLPKKDSNTIPDCTRESVGYALECGDCRMKGTLRRYVGDI